jgi:gamma-glutamylcyclotransferase (GGCT)/AIG2-like uncharacterized protein YtfP
MAAPSADEVMRWIGAANAAGGASEAARLLDVHFGSAQVLAAYGTLAPGRRNHHVVAPLGGEWTRGVVEGELSRDGWGKTSGYPGFRPREGAGAVWVHVLTSPALPSAWPELDAFEGAEYRRILVPVFQPEAPGVRTLYTVANIYAVA